MRWSAALLALSLGMFVQATTSFCVIGLALEIAEEFTLPPSAIAATVAAYALAAGICAPMLQRTSLGRLRYVVQVVVGLGGIAIGAIASALAHEFWFMLVGRVVTGVGAALFNPACASTVGILAGPTNRGRLQARVQAGFALASVVSVPAAAWASQWLGWRAVLLSIGGLGIGAALFACVSLLGRRDSGPSVNEPVRWLALARRGTIGCRLATTMFNVGSRFCLLASVPGLLIEHCSLERSQLAGWLAAYGIAGFLGNLAGGQLADRIGVSWTLRVASILFGFGMLSLVPSTGTGGAVLVVLCAFAGAIFTVPLVTGLVRDEPQQLFGMLHALNASALTAGVTIGSTLSSIVIPVFGYEGMIVGSIGLLAGSALVHERSFGDVDQDAQPA